MTEGGAVAVGSDDPVIGNAEVRRLEERIRELERLLGRKTLEVEILKEALGRAQAKKPILRSLSPLEGRFPVKAIADTLGVSRSNLVERAARGRRSRRRHIARPAILSCSCASGRWSTRDPPTAIAGSRRS